MKISRKKRAARLTSNIVNPFSVSLAMIILLSFASASDTFEALKWTLISIALSILPVFAVIIYLVRNNRLEGIFIKARKQRNKIYLLASVCAVVGNVIFISFEAPLVLVATFIAGLSAVVIFMGVNLLWKISLHAALIAASVTLLVILYGPTAIVTAVLLPLIAWARLKLGCHSLAQVVVGALLSSLIVAIVFYLFGLV